MGERLARIALACMVEPGNPTVAQQVAEHGAEWVLARLPAELGAASGIPAGRLRRDEVADMLDVVQRQGVRVIVAGDAEYPSQLLDLPEAPLALWVRGPLDLRMAALRSVAIVGARACTAYGEQAAGLIASTLATDGWSVVSGGAFGIDAAAHRAALAVDGATVAVLACGVDVAYPRAHDALISRIADTGAVVSELPPGSAPLKHRFLARNRLIAALTRGTVVVEAARRSGALATANRALELGRDLMAVPGPITSMASTGTNRLLHDGSARAVCSGADVAEVLLSREPLGRAQPPAPQGASLDAVVVTGHPDAAAEAVLAALPRRDGLTVEAVAERAGIGPADCLARLGVLEITGLARRGPRGWRRAG